MDQPNRNMEDIDGKGYLYCGGLTQEFSKEKNISMWTRQFSILGI